MPMDERPLETVREEAAHWITQRDCGLLTQKGEAELARWLDAAPSHRAVYARLDRVWGAMGDASVAAGMHGSATVLSLGARATSYRERMGRRWLSGAIAASLAVLAIGTIGDWPTRLRADAMTAAGEQCDITLTDGSVVKLNSASAVAIEYGAGKRTIDLLKGEAAFIVAADPARPFTVIAGNGSTTALGTRFNIRRKGDDTDVTVTEHSVRITGPDRGGSAATVHEGQSVRYGQSGIGLPHAVDTDMAMAWTRGSLVFVDRPLGEVVAELDRYHGGYIGVLGSGLAERRFSGVLPITDPVEALDTIQQSLGIRSTRITNRLIFLHR